MARAVGPASASIEVCEFISSVTSRASTPSRFSARCVIGVLFYVCSMHICMVHMFGGECKWFFCLWRRHWLLCLRRWLFPGFLPCVAPLCLCAYGVGLSLICYWSISFAP